MALKTSPNKKTEPSREQMNIVIVGHVDHGFGLQGRPHLVTEKRDPLAEVGPVRHQAHDRLADGMGIDPEPEWGPRPEGW